MHAQTYFKEVRKVAESIDTAAVERLASELAALRERGGRLFVLGVGGGAGNCSHAVNDFRKLCGIEAYAPTDNVSELTARTNDEGWDTVFAAWLRTSRGSEKDAVLVFSVGGGNLERNVSPNIVAGLKEAKARGMKVFGVVGRDGGYTRQVGGLRGGGTDRGPVSHYAAHRSFSGGGLVLPRVASGAPADGDEVVALAEQAPRSDLSRRQGPPKK
jgi:D-sedoheptulose 7-phosphate isomerase